MLRNVIIIVALCVTAIGFALTFTMYEPKVITGFSNTAFDSEQIGSKVPSFAFETIDGQQGTLDDFQGKTVLIHFFASWCAPCVIEFPELVQALKNNQDDVVMLAISSDNEAADLDLFMDRYAPDIPANIYIIRDDQQKTLTEKFFGTYKLPETYILNADLTVREKIVGAYADWVTVEF